MAGHHALLLIFVSFPSNTLIILRLLEYCILCIIKSIMKKVKTAKQMERHLKGMANHYRIEILLLLSQHPDLTLDSLIKNLDANQKTVSEHTRRLQHAGLINKKYQGRFVEHTLSPYGELFVHFLKSFRVN